MRPLTATLRLQFHRGFTLDDATELVPYAEHLGISHIYASPLLTARPGSTHGYDIVDHSRINPELGGEPALRRLVTALRARGMGLILDIVPNHMGVGGADNAWWLDVLEWGRASPFAEFFDIDWDPPDAWLRGRLLAPFLGAPYGDCLRRGELALAFDPQDGRFVVRYFEHRFPINPRDYRTILERAGMPELPAQLRLPAGAPRTGLRAAAERVRALLLAPEHQAAIQRALAAYAAPTEGWENRLHQLLERQNYRLAWWRAASDEINWRRFFDIISLAGIRVEVPAAFAAVHAKVLALYGEGLIDGVRVDHVDGLADPRGYCRKLRRALTAAAATRPPELGSAPAVLWVEKILAPHEHLPRDWLTDGTTGYDFMAEVSAFQHAASGEAKLTALWTELTGRPAEFAQEARAARRQILAEALSSEVLATATALHRIARRDLASRDWTLTAIRRVLTALLVHFPVYRIYAFIAGMAEADARVLEWARAGAARALPATDADLLALVVDYLSGVGLRTTRAGPARQEWLRAMVRFQQLSAPTAAKSVEDTAFYRYGRQLARNEVGSDPAQFALAPAALHAANRARAQHLPRALLATATHDHKRGEDMRARLAVLSEIPEEWEAALGRWMRLNAPYRRELDGPAPDAADEIMLYQTLVGAWPPQLSADNHAAMQDFRDRIGAWQEKALREAKRHSSWAAPNAAYESACQDFLAQVLNPERLAPVAADIAGFAARLAPAGIVNSLAQLVLRCTCPGVPDLYQGTEFWDFSLVDPDNRRPVDFAARQQALAQGASPAQLLSHWRDGLVKQAVLHRLLQLRRVDAGFFARAKYFDVTLDGPLSHHAFAFFRRQEERAVIVAVTRHATSLLGDATTPHVDPGRWQGTAMILPRSFAGRPLVDVLGEGSGTAAAGASIGATAGTAVLGLEQVFAHLPVAVLEVR